MMRHALVALVLSALVVLVMGSGPGGALTPGPSRLALQATLLTTVKAGPITTARTYALYNRPAYKQRIGTGVSSCTRVSADWETCHIYIRLGRGEILGDTLVPVTSTFVTFGVLGGTGYYSNVGGTVTVQPLGQDAYLLLGTLEAFG